MHKKEVVVLDACILYPAPLRDLLMRLALANLYRPLWTEQIHQEWIKSLLQKRPELSQEQLTRTKNLMNQHAGDALVKVKSVVAQHRLALKNPPKTPWEYLETLRNQGLQLSVLGSKQK